MLILSTHNIVSCLMYFYLSLYLKHSPNSFKITYVYISGLPKNVNFGKDGHRQIPKNRLMKYWKSWRWFNIYQKTWMDLLLIWYQYPLQNIKRQFRNFVFVILESIVCDPGAPNEIIIFLGPTQLASPSVTSFCEGGILINFGIW